MRLTLLISTSAMSLLALTAVPSEMFAQEQQSTVHSPRYVVTDLGTLGGTSSIALGVNYAGGVAGSSNLTIGGPQHAFLGHGGNLKDLGTLGGLNSIGDGPNARD